MYNSVCDIYCKDANLLISTFKKMVKDGLSEEEAISKLYALCPTKRDAAYLLKAIPIPMNNIFICPNTRNSNMQDSREVKKYIKWLNDFDNMKFDYVIQNPPYDDTLHLDFFNKGLDLLESGGTMVIINPSTWAIKVKKSKKADKLKERLDSGDYVINSVNIENFGNDFGIVQTMPLIITSVTKRKMEETDRGFEYKCCGDSTRTASSIYDCGLVGNTSICRSILNKVTSKCDVMKNHMTNEDLGKKYWYCKCVGNGKDSLISGAGAAICGALSKRVGMTYDSEAMWVKTKNGYFLLPYTSICYHYYKNGIQNEPHLSYDAGKKLTDKIAWNVYGTKDEIENWKHFVFNNKLPLFINIVLTFNQHNNSSDNIPWLVDKQYTDEEINSLFGFTEEEIAIIDRTIKQFERESPWFKRLMCGPESVTNEEVNNFMESL